MLVLGIDQSLRSTGVFWLHPTYNGHLTIQPTYRRGADRLLFIRNKFRDLLQQHQPTLVALEGYSYGSPGKAYQIGELGGVLRLTLFEANVPFIVATPTQVKKFATGHGKAEKEEMVEVANSHFGFDWSLKQNDVADASALARIAQSYLEPEKINLRHQAEVIAEIRASLNLKGPRKSKKSRLKKRFHKI